VAQGARRQRDRDVPRADDRRKSWFPGEFFAFLVDRFNHHHGVVHQHADRQQQPHHRQDVERHPREVHESQGHHEADRDRQRHHQRRRPVAQEEEQHRDRQHQADRACFGQREQRTGHLAALVVGDVDVDAAHRRIVAYRFDLGAHGAGQLHEVGGALLVDVYADRRPAVDLAHVVHALRLEGHLRDVRQARAGIPHRQVAQRLQRLQLALGLHPQSLAAVRDHARRHREVRRLQALHQGVQADAMRVQALGRDRDLHFLAGDALHFHARDAGQAFQAALEVAVDQVGTGGEVDIAGQAQAHRLLVRGAPAMHEIAAEIIRELVADGIDALARLGCRHHDVPAPVAEAHLDAAAVGVRLRVHRLDARHGGDRFLDRPYQVALDLLGRGPRIRQLHEEERHRGFREGLQRKPDGRNQADDQHRHEEHDRGDRPADAELGDVHASSLPRSA